MSRALKAAEAAYNVYKQKNPKATPADVARWAEDALDPNTGLAFWERPASKDVRAILENIDYMSKLPNVTHGRTRRHMASFNRRI